MSDFIEEKSYEEILSEMCDDFKQKSGFYPDNASDIGIRLKVLASQIYSLNHKLNFIWKQSSPLSAVGEYLDKHAYEKGIERKSGKQAYGIVKFILEEPLSVDKDIESGTLIATNTLSTAIKFATAKSITIPAGQTQAEVSAYSVEIGIEGNVSAGAIKVIENPALSLFSVTNENPFTGGTQEETDENLRKRILESYQLPIFDGNESYYKSVALSDEEVVSAGVIPVPRGAGTVDVAIATSDPIPSATVIQRVQDIFDSKAEFGVSVTVIPPQLNTISVFGDLTLMPGYDTNEVSNACKNIVNKYINSLGVGESFIKADVYKQIMETEGVKNITLYTPSDDTGTASGVLINCSGVSFNVIK